MAAPDYYTWDFALPARSARAASVEDLGGAKLRDDAAYPPIPPEMPYAAQLNQWAKQLGGVNRVIVGLDVEIRFIAGTPTVVNATGMSDLLTTSYVIANFTVTHPSTGVVEISWAPGTLPPPRAQPRAWITDANPYAQPVVVAGPNAITVRTWNVAGAPTNAPFVVSIL